MKDTLSSGLQVTRQFQVDEQSTVGFMGKAARVYATPALVRDIEITCRDLLMEHLDEGEDSVGTRVELDHLAATLLGMTVDITAEIVDLKGRAVNFEVTARDPLDQICRCRHGRFIVDIEKTKARIAAKAAKAAGES